MRTARLALAAVGGVALVGVGVIDVQGASAQARPRQQEGRGGEWPQEMRQPERGMARPMQGPMRQGMEGMGGRITPEERRKLANHHADLTSPLDQEAAGQLQRAWYVQTEGNVSGSPLIEGGRVYFADWSGNVYCVEEETGREVWRKKVGEPKAEWPWHGFVGTGALDQAGEVLFLASAEGTAYAIGTEDGEVVWERRIAEDEHAGNTGGVLHHNGVVYVGLSSVEEVLHETEEGFEPDFRGSVVALSAEDGEIVWDAQLVEEPSNGAAVWGGFALDPDAGVLYFATGSNLTGEPSLLSNAVLAVDAGSGELVWAQQTTPNDVWTWKNPQGPGFAFRAAPQLFNAVVDGQMRRLVGAGQTSGMYWAWDRRSGEAVWATPVGYGQIGGGIFAAASIGRDRIVITGNNAFAFENPEQHQADVKAVEVGTGKPVWVRSKVQPAQLTSAGFLTRDVYFSGSLDGKIRAFNAETGEDVWTSPEHASIASAICGEGDAILFGTGLPPKFGGREGGQKGVFCYRVGAAEGGQAQREQEANVRPAAERLGEGGARPAATPAAQGAAAARVIRIVAKESGFEPKEIKVRPGEEVTVLLVNEGERRHTIEFELPDGRKGLDKTVGPREEGRLSFTAPQKPGRYAFRSSAGDGGAGGGAEGRKGMLVVEEAGAGDKAEEKPDSEKKEHKEEKKDDPSR